MKLTIQLRDYIEKLPIQDGIDLSFTFTIVYNGNHVKILNSKEDRARDIQLLEKKNGDYTYLVNLNKHINLDDFPPARVPDREYRKYTTRDNQSSTNIPMLFLEVFATTPQGVCGSVPMMIRLTKDQLTRNIPDQIVPVFTDRAQTIVGHTTNSSTMLWFCLQNANQRGGTFECILSTSKEELAVNVNPHPYSTLEKTFPINIDFEKSNTATIEINDLRPNTKYYYKLREIHSSLKFPITSGEPVLNKNISLPTSSETDTSTWNVVDIATGSFLTVKDDKTSLDFMFASCHDPFKINDGETENDVYNRWKVLVNYTEITPIDMLLLIGDQIYGDDLERESTWLDAYSNAYRLFWHNENMRNVLRRIPTYMIFDDHDVHDDWGTVDFNDPTRINEALRAYRIFQQAHNPGGYNSENFFYSIKKGPASFFVIDGRNQRKNKPTDNGELPILGALQRQKILEWAKSTETQSSDIIFMVLPVPIAYLPVQEVKRLFTEFKKAAEVVGADKGFWGGVKAVFTKPYEWVGPFAPIVWPLTILASPYFIYKGVQIGTAAADAEIAKSGIENIDNDLDLEDLWNKDQNQSDMAFLLDTLFDLANDTYHGGAKPKAVFILSGDVHAGAIHEITSKKHKKNPKIFQITSSGITKTPATDPIMKHMVEHLRIDPAVHIRAGDIEFYQDNGGPLALLQAKITSNSYFALDTSLPNDTNPYVNYWARLKKSKFGARNFGHITVKKQPGITRTYRIRAMVESSLGSIFLNVSVNLDDPGATLTYIESTTIDM
jgi:phosphodiesterase/alkaline phosphatase D-like protein